MRKAIYTALGTVALIATFAFGSQYFKNRPFVPEEFSQARITGAAASDKLNHLLNDSLKNLSEIERDDRQADTTGALLLITRELNEGRPQKAETAITLSSALEKMATAIPEIKPATARQTALEAVSSAVAAASRLGNYTGYLEQLFIVLKAKFDGRAIDPNTQVKDLISKINDEATAINNLNAQFTGGLEKFDKFYKK